MGFIGKMKNKYSEKCLKEILKFLKNNEINNWSKFLKISPFDKKVIDHIINFEKNNNDVSEINFYLRLELSDKKELEDFLKICEEEEEYEKCKIILKKIKKIK